MVWAALLYAGVGSWVTWLLGRPLVNINVERNGREADFRFSLVRLRESSEAVALIRGEQDERQGLKRNFGRIAVVWEALMRAQRRLMWLTSAYGSLVMVFPTLVACRATSPAPSRWAGSCRSSPPSARFRAPSNWFVDNFPRLAEWRSAVERVLAFRAAIEGIERLADDPSQPTIDITEGCMARSSSSTTSRSPPPTAPRWSRTRPRASGAASACSSRRTSGSGKSTLFRAVGRMWPWGSGRIVVPPRERTMFLPQRPDPPLGTLRAVLAYPEAGTRYSNAVAIRN